MKIVGYIAGQGSDYAWESEEKHWPLRREAFRTFRYGFVMYDAENDDLCEIENWCETMMGPMALSVEGQGRWYHVFRDVLYFRDETDAAHFKLRWF